MQSKSKIEYSKNGCTFTTTYVTGGILKENRNAIYGSSLINNTSTARLNNKDYIIDNKTGRVKAKKATIKEKIFGVSKTVLNSISETINKLQKHFENSKIVEQYSWGINGYTPKGSAIIDEAIKKYNQSLTTTGKLVR